MKNSYLYLLIASLAFLNIYQYFKPPINNKIEIEVENPYGQFSFKSDLTCIIKQSTDLEKKVNENISLIGLDSENPKALFEHDGGTSPLTEMYDNANTYVVGLVAGSGSTDIFTLNKKTGQFTRTEAGNVGGVYGFVSKGFCK